jgi:hypothetical protein
VSELWRGLGLVLMGDERCRLFSDSFCFLGTGGGRYDGNSIAISVRYVLERILYWVNVINQQSCKSAFRWSHDGPQLLHGKPGILRRFAHTLLSLPNNLKVDDMRKHQDRWTDSQTGLERCSMPANAHAIDSHMTI